MRSYRFFRYTQLPLFPRAPQHDRAVDDRRSQLAHHVRRERKPFAHFPCFVPAVVRGEVEAVARASMLVHLAHLAASGSAEESRPTSRTFRRVGGGVILAGSLHRVKIPLGNPPRSVVRVDRHNGPRRRAHAAAGVAAHRRRHVARLRLRRARRRNVELERHFDGYNLTRHRALKLAPKGCLESEMPRMAVAS